MYSRVHVERFAIIPREVSSREVYNLVAREARVLHKPRKASVISSWL